MLVVCCGMPRSGSTLQYQIAAAVVRDAGLGDAAGWDWSSVAIADADPDSPFRVVKVHEPDPSFESALPPEGVAYLLTYRDTRDAAASFLAKFGDRSPSDLEQEVSRWVANQRRFLSNRRVLSSRYETFTSDLPTEVERIAAFLGASLDEHAVSEIASSLAPDRQRERVEVFEQSTSSAWDPTTLLHRGHLADGAIGKWKASLSREHLDAVLRASGEWLVEFGYADAASIRGAA